MKSRRLLLCFSAAVGWTWLSGCDLGTCCKPQEPLPIPRTDPCCDDDARHAEWISRTLGQEPSNVRSFVFEPLHMSLTECIALAMENLHLPDGDVDVSRVRPVHIETGAVLETGSLNVSLTGDLEPEKYYEYRATISETVFRVEEAYWNLYRAQSQLAITEERIRQSELQLSTAEERLEAGQLTRQDVFRLKLDLEQAYEDRLRQRGGNSGEPGVLEAEQQLRVLLNLPADPVRQLATVDPPQDLPPHLCWSEDALDAMKYRSELLEARKQVVLAQREIEKNIFELKRAQQSGRFPRFCCISFDPKTCSKTLIGLFQGQKQKPQSPDPFQDYVRVLQARDKKEVACRTEHNTEQQVIETLLQTYRKAVEQFELLQLRRARVETAAELVALTVESHERGLTPLDEVVEARRALAQQRTAVVAALTEYNIALAEYEWLQGTLLSARNIEFERDYHFGWVWHKEGETYRPAPYIPEEGDIVLMTSKSGFMTQAAWYISGANHPHHSTIIVRRSDGSLAIFESGGAADLELRASLRSVKWRFRDQLTTNKSPLLWVRQIRRPLTAVESAAMTHFAEETIGKKFAPMTRFIFLFLPGRPAPQTRDEQYEWFCSEAVLRALQVAGLVPDALNPGAVVPRDMFYDLEVDLSPLYYAPIQWTPTPQLPEKRPPLAQSVTRENSTK